MIKRLVLRFLDVDRCLSLFGFEEDQGGLSYYVEVPFQLIRNQAIS